MTAAFLIRAGATVSSGVSYEAEATALFARFSSDPGTTRKDAINACIASLKTAGVWAKLSNFYVLAAHDSQAAKLNWVTNARNITESGTGGTFTADQGFASGNTGHKYVVDTTDGVIFLQDSAHAAIWVRNDVEEAASTLQQFGAGNNIYPRYPGGDVYCRLHDASETGAFGNLGSSLGLTLANRSSSTARQAYRNGSSISTTTQASTTVSSTWWIGDQSAHQVSVASFGASLTSGEVSDFYNALNTLKTAIGW
jgi:hypothetical protein